MERKEEARAYEQEDSVKGEPYYSKIPEFGNKGPSKLRQYFNNGLTYFWVVATCVMFYFALLRFDAISTAFVRIVEVLKPILYGLVIAYLLNPVVKQIDKLLVPVLVKKMSETKARKIARAVGVIVALVFMIVLIVALCNMLIPELYKSIRNLIYTLPDQLNDLTDWIDNLIAQDTTLSMLFKNVMEQATDTLLSWLRTDLMSRINKVMSGVTVGVITIFSEVFNFLIGLIVSVYILFSKEIFSAQGKKCIYAFFSIEQANMILHLTKKSDEIFGGFFIGKIIDSAIIGVLCFLGLTILDMPYIMLVSVIVGVTNVIPFFGPYIGAIPSALLILLSDPRKGIYFIFFILLLQQLDGNVIGPKILGNSTGLSAFWVIFAILLGGGLFGFVGMIMGVPTVAVIYYVTTMFVSDKLKRKNLPVETAQYGAKNYVDDKGRFVSEDHLSVEQEKQ